MRLARRGCRAMRDLLGEEREEQRIVGPLLLLCALTEVAPHASSVGEMEALEERLEIGAHDAPPFDSCAAYRQRELPSVLTAR